MFALYVQTATNRAVEVHEASRKKDSGAQVLPLSDGMLHQLCKSALAMEIDAQEHAERILHLLRCNRWRARVDAVLGAGSAGNAAPGAPPGKASAEAVAKLLIEADRLEVDTKTDVAGVRLLEAADKTRVWQESVKQCIADLKAAGSAHDPAFAEASARAKELAKDAESLPIRVDRELEKLAEYSKPYCLCRRTYDEQIPMLECDSCSEWYHFGCVGLKAPGSGNDDGDSVPERFSCPVCCLKSQTKYAFFHRLPQTSVDALKEMADAMPPPQRAAPAPTTAQGAGPNAGATNMSNPAAAAAAAAAAAHMMYPQGWQFAMGRGGIPVPMMPGMMNPQALQQMMEAFPGAMPPMMHPGMMFGFPGMHQAMAAAAAAQQQQLQQQQQQQQQEARAAAEGAQQAAAPVKGDGGSSAPAAAGDGQEGGGGGPPAAT